MTADSFKVTGANAGNYKVTLNVTDGWLKITKADVRPEAATVTGIQTEIGTSDNVVSNAEIKAGDVDVTGNYDISYEKGTLTVTGRNPDDSVVPGVPPVSPSKPVLNTEDHYSYIIGYKDGTLRPYGTITRGEVATIFFRLLTDGTREEYWSQTNNYADCNSELWCNNAISTLSNMGIIDGFEDGTFRPNKPITRAAIAARFSDVADNGGSSFTDVPENHWAVRFISLAEHWGWLASYSGVRSSPIKP